MLLHWTAACAWINYVTYTKVTFDNATECGVETNGEDGSRIFCARLQYNGTETFGSAFEDGSVFSTYNYVRRTDMAVKNMWKVYTTAEMFTCKFAETNLRWTKYTRNMNVEDCVYFNSDKEDPNTEIGYLARGYFPRGLYPGVFYPTDGFVVIIAAGTPRVTEDFEVLCPFSYSGCYDDTELQCSSLPTLDE